MPRLSERHCWLHQRDPTSKTENSASANELLNASLQWQQAKERMIANGWCPHQVRHLSIKHDLQSDLHLATLERSPLRVVDHQRCSLSESCVAYNTDPATYKVRHTTADCACSVLCVPYEQLLSIIRKSRVPLVSIKDAGAGANERYEIRLVPRSEGFFRSKYFAITHVWADGLGNPKQNGLPLCQVKRLRLCNTLFWMDTLCIPVGAGEHSLRLAQIDKMASIYTGASCSLLLDAELMSLADGPSVMSPVSMGVEFHARLACSIWMTRSWTLQEGKLPAKIAVRLRNSIVMLGRTSQADGRYTERLFSKLGNDEHSRRSNEMDGPSRQALDILRSGGSHACHELESVQTFPRRDCQCVDIALQHSLYDTFFLEGDSRNRVRRFESVWDELAGRSTTMANDVPLIMTNMLNLENRGLLDLDSAGQMLQAIMLSLDWLPISVFYNTGPRHDQDGSHHNRWIPTKIDQSGFASPGVSLKVWSSHLEYAYSHSAQDRNTMMYTTAHLLAFKSETCLSVGSPDNIYVVQPSVAVDDRFDRKGFTSTCLLIEHWNSHSHEDLLRGAAFYVHDRAVFQEKGYRRVWRWLSQRKAKDTEPPNLDVTFYCPLRLRKVTASEQTALDKSRAYALGATESCNLRVSYGMYHPW